VRAGRAAREIAERALEAAPPGDALAHVSAERSLTLRFARSRPTQATGIEDVTVMLAVARGGRVGTATTNRTDRDSLAACGRAAAAAADASLSTGGEGEFPGFPSVGASRPHHGFDAATAELDPAVGGAALADAFAACAERGCEAHGTWSAGDVSTAVASRAGAHASERGTDVFMKVTAFAPGGRSGFAEGTAASVSDVSARALGERAAAKAAFGGGGSGSVGALALPPGEYPVVLEADAVGELVAWLAHLAHNGLAYAEGRSALNDRLGERVVAARINLSDSPRYARTLPRSFDAEGVPKAPIPLIQDGVAHRVVHDTRSAALCGAKSTGHAIVPGGAASGPELTNLVLIGGGAADETELARPISRGVYVTRLWYTNPVREKETLLTGVTRDGTFLIEDGELTRPIEDMRVTDSILRVLSGCEELGRATRLISEGEFYGRRQAVGVVAAPMRAVMRFTG
jgi:predicted Zn-dependent protease